jgi:hypothetical protein
MHTKKQGGPDWLSLNIYLMFFTCAALHTKSKGLLIDGPLISILCFLHVQYHIQKARGSRLTVPQHLSYAFCMRNTAYKEKGAPDWRSLNIYLMFLHAQSHTKSKGLSIDSPLISNTFCTHRVSRSRLTYQRTFHTTFIIGVWKARGIYISISRRYLARIK